MTVHHCEIEYVAEYVHPAWDGKSRPGWFVTCSVCGPRGIDRDGVRWAYHSVGIARQVASRHMNSRARRRS